MIILRAEASLGLGGGALSRALTLARHFKKIHRSVVLVCSPETHAMAAPFLNNDVAVEEITCPLEEEAKWMARRFSQAAALIVDYKEYTKEHETPCRAFAKKIVVLDTSPSREHDCDILLDHTPGHTVEDYAPLVPQHCQLMLGPLYAVLKPEFAKLRPKILKERREKKLERIFISLGASDRNRVSDMAVRAVAQTSASLEVDITFHPRDPVLPSIRHLAQDLQNKITVHEGDVSIESLMAKADLSIGAPGMTSWERCCLGLPSLIILTSDSQRPLARYMEEKGTAQILGWHDTLSAQTVSSKIDSLRDGEKLYSMSKNAAAQCDGLGVARLVGAIEAPEDLFFCCRDPMRETGDKTDHISFSIYKDKKEVASFCLSRTAEQAFKLSLESETTEAACAVLTVVKKILPEDGILPDEQNSIDIIPLAKDVGYTQSGSLLLLV